MKRVRVLGSQDEVNLRRGSGRLGEELLAWGHLLILHEETRSPKAEVRGNREVNADFRKRGVALASGLYSKLN
jgi:hypothetical protein